MRLALAVVAALTVAACSQPTEPTPEPAEPAVLGGVDLGQPLRALGTEPFWAVEITPDTLTYSGVDRPERRASHTGPTVQGTTAVYTGAVGDDALVVTLMATECSDGMSDRTYPLAARVEVGGETLIGCAASLADLASGEVQGPTTPIAAPEVAPPPIPGPAPAPQA